MRCLIILLFLVSSATAQNTFQPDSAFISIMNDLPNQQPFDTAHTYKKVSGSLIYLKSRGDVYNIFGYETQKNFSDFNFTEQHILGINISKNNEWIWLLRENKKAFTVIPSKTLPGHTSAEFTQGRKSFYNDTVITPKADSLSYWYTTGRGDCHASFAYYVSTDNYYPVALLTEIVYWGGCRAAGSKDFTVTYNEPKGIKTHIKTRISVERYKE
jgi:hypothetical protein